MCWCLFVEWTCQCLSLCLCASACVCMWLRQWAGKLTHTHSHPCVGGYACVCVCAGMRLATLGVDDDTSESPGEWVNMKTTLWDCLTFNTHTNTPHSHTHTHTYTYCLCVCLRVLARVVVAAASASAASASAAAAFHCSCAAWPPQVFCHFYLCFYISTLPQSAQSPQLSVAGVVAVAVVAVIVWARFVWLLNITLDIRPCWLGNKHAHVQLITMAAQLLFIYFYK